MATRTISTKLTIDGESEYRAALSRINTELKTLQSNLKLTESQYQTNANSMEALKAKGDALASLYDAQKSKVDTLKTALENAKTAHDNFAQKSEELKAKIQANSDALEKLRATTGDTAAEEQKLIKENEALNAELAKNEQYTAAAEKGVNSWQTQLNKAQIDLNNLDAELKQNDALLDEAKNSADGCAHSIDEFGNEVKDSSNAVDALAQALAAAGLAKTAQEIAEALKDCIDSSIRFESAMTGVAKTTDLSDKELDDMADAVKTLTTQIPITATELAGIVEAAGQLGIAKENLLDFATVMANLGVATNMTAEEAAVMLAQFANVTNMDPENYERLGSVLVELGNNFATNEKEITEMSHRLASAGTIAGLTEPEIMALSTAMASVGIKAEAGGTAMAQTLSKIETAVASGSDSLNLYAQVAGMSAGEFANAWENEPIVALQSFIEGLGRLDEEGESVTLVLEELDLKGIRQTNMLKALGTASGLLANAVDTANGAWEKNNALQNEAEKRYATTESKITMYKNSVENLKIAIGDQLTPAIGNLAEKGSGIIDWASKLVQENEWLAPAITAVATAMGTFAATAAGAAAVIEGVRIAQSALNTVMDANPYLLVASAITAVVAALVTLAATMPEDEYKSLTAASKDQYDHLQQLNEEYERACELQGADSEEARKLAGQIAVETEQFEKNKTTLQQVSDKTAELISRQNALRDSSEETESTIEEQRNSSEYLLGKLEDLMGEEEKSAGTKQQILAVVDLLNEQIPNLGLAYDEYTDSLKLNSEAMSNNAEAIQKVIDKELERERLEANYRELKSEMLLQQDIETQLAVVRENLQAATDRLAAAEKARDDAAANYDGSAAFSGLTDYIVAVDVAEAEVEDLTEQESKLSEALESSTEKIEQLSGAYDELNKEVANGADNASAEEQAVQRISNKLDALAKSYRDAYDAAHDSITGMFDLWEQAPYVAANSVEEMMAAQQSQGDWLEWYGQLFDDLMNRNIEGVELLGQTVADVTPENAAALAGFYNASDEELQALINTMKATQGEQDVLSEKVAAVKTDVQGQLDELKKEYADSVKEIAGAGGDVDFDPFVTAVKNAFEKVGAQFEKAGTDAGIGLQNGITLKSGEVYTAANDMGQGIIDALLTVLDENSPSKKTEEIGENIDAGLIKGIEGQADQATDTAEDLGNQIVNKLSEAGSDAVDGFDTELEELDDHIRQVMEEARATIAEYNQIFKEEMNNLGSQMIDGMTDGIYSRSGYLYDAMQNVVSEAIEEARRAADVHSPSRKTREIFENVAEGMAVGVESKRERVAEATQDVVDDALRIDTSGMIDAIRMLDANKPDISAFLAGKGHNTSPSAPPVSSPVTVNVTIPGMVVREEADIDKISRKIAADVSFAIRQRGHR